MSLTSLIICRNDRCRCAYCNAPVDADARAFLDTATNRVYCSRACGVKDQEDLRIERIAEEQRLREEAEFDMAHASERFEMY